MKKIISVLLILVLLLCGCENPPKKEKKENSDQITVIATLFPQYDFAREIAGDKANISLLLPPGMESHSFEPTPGDIIDIQNSDVFLYTGDEMEPWVSGIVSNLDQTTLIANLSDGIELCQEEHDHEEEHHHEEEAHHHEYNPHIWTSPVLAMQMVKNVENALVEADPDNEEYYRENASIYLSKLKALHERFQSIVKNGRQDTIYIGSRFSLYYFMKEYNLQYMAAYDSCEEEAEPSIKRVVSMIQKMKASGVKAIYYEELVEPYIAETIAEAANAQPLLFHSCHNVSKDELNAGVTYLSLMEQNALNLEKGLQ